MSTFLYILSCFDPTKKLKNEINLEKNRQEGIRHQIMDIKKYENKYRMLQHKLNLMAIKYLHILHHYIFCILQPNANYLASTISTYMVATRSKNMEATKYRQFSDH